MYLLERKKLIWRKVWKNVQGKISDGNYKKGDGKKDEKYENSDGKYTKKRNPMC